MELEPHQFTWLLVLISSCTSQPQSTPSEKTILIKNADVGEPGPVNTSLALLKAVSMRPTDPGQVIHGVSGAGVQSDSVSNIQAQPGTHHEGGSAVTLPEMMPELQVPLRIDLASVPKNDIPESPMTLNLKSDHPTPLKFTPQPVMGNASESYTAQTSAPKFPASPAAPTKTTAVGGEAAAWSAGGAGGELPVRLAGPDATPPAGRSRHRPEPGLAPSEDKPSSRRTGVPDLEMIENPSKPRKGVPSAPAPEVAVRPQSAAPPPPGPDVSEEPAAVAASPPHQLASYAGPEELAGETVPLTSADLSKARVSTLVGVGFIVCFVLVMGWLVFRKASDRWQHRHYRKMDFLVDGMYNL
ncbi:translation initiation factor IF-2-like [Pollicipes pollicipes]|uniref:translation initiation factor IF-2-like n=1 Tax=Pollicipes pollicipes TaxID=41117 RepID=UPI001884A264|nr:translation initiation factor IF-2-like [Pollicipes pollicipes]XP_037069829.1 translation initiation factor IF-2-like [Pollicipes pollicipes]XP_037069830.1 translation initiation factor IF-2-like [Pollicipes pollicipes]